MYCDLLLPWQPKKGKLFTWDTEYLYSKWYTFISHYHVKLLSIKCKPWNWVCMRTAKHLAANPFHIQKGCYSLSVPWLCAQMPSPFAFLLSAKGSALFRVWVLICTVGGTVTTVCACWFLSAVCEWSGFSLHYIFLLSGALTAGRKSQCFLMIMQLIKEPIVLARHV